MGEKAAALNLMSTLTQKKKKKKRSLQCKWLSIMPGIMLIDCLVQLHKGSGCQGFGVSKSCQHSCSVGTVLGSDGTKGAAKVMVWKPDLCNAPSGALGSLTWTHEVTQGNSEGTGFSEDPSTQDSGEGLEVKGEV
jgi:hypothetical protein